MTNRLSQTAVRILALALLYFFTGWLGLMLPAFGSHITLLWLPTGIAVAALLRCSFRCWPGVTLGAVAINLVTGTPWQTALGIAIGNTVGPLLSASLLKRIGLHPAFDRRRDILLLAGAAAIGMLVSASGGVLTLALAGALGGGWPVAWLVWWAGDIMGVIAAAPLLLSVTKEEWRRFTSRFTEFFLWLCTAGPIAFGVFFFHPDPAHRMWAPSFLTLPLVAWAALRFGTIGTSFAIIMLSTAAVSGTATGHGPFSRHNPGDAAAVVWLYMATCAALGWLITALQAGRNKAVAMQNASTDFANTLIDSMQDGFSLLDANGDIVNVNPAFCKMTGFARGELIRQKLHPYWPPEERERIHTALAETMEGKFSNFELIFMRKNGKRFPVIVSPSAVVDGNGKYVNFLATVKDITERKKAEEALRQNEEHLRMALTASAAGTWSWDVSSNRSTWDDRYHELYGLAPDAPRSFETWIACIHPEDRTRLLERIASLVESSTDNEWSEEFRASHPTKGERWMSGRGTVARDATGKAICMTGLNLDVTARRQSDEALRMASQKLKLHFEQTPMAVIEWDLEFRVTQWNPAAQTIFGYSREEAIGRHASFIVPEKAREHVEHVCSALMHKVAGERSTNENVRKDGTHITCEWYNTPLVDEQGTAAGAASVVLDITERRQAQQLLAWEMNAMESISSPASLHDVLDGLMHGLEIQAPGALCSILLLDDDGIHLRHGAAPSLPAAYNKAIDGAAIGPKAGSCGTAAYSDRQVIVEDIATDPLWSDYRDLAAAHGLRACWSTPLHGSNGKILGTFAIYHREPRKPVAAELELIARATHIIRITIERKHAEQALRENGEKYRTLFENAGDAIFLMQGELFTDCNARTLEVFGCQTRSQIIGHPPYEFSPAMQPNGRDSQTCAIEKITAALGGQPQFFEWMHTKADGTPFPAEVTLNAVVLGGQKMLQAIVRDISERKIAEEHIRALNAGLERRVEQRTSDLKAANSELEAFTYTVSHDLRAPLRSVDGFSQVVQKKYAEQLGDDGRKLLGMIRTGAKQMGQLINDLLAFSRIGRAPLEPVEIDMASLARAVFDDLAASDPERTVRLQLHPIPTARGTPAMIRQMWMNLISNAIKFTKGREVAEIEIGTQDGGNRGPIYYVKDNGAGFDMRFANRLFGVFQRLHGPEEFEGTGVGLALVQRIVQRHGGTVWAEAELNRGATFYFTLSNCNQ